MQDLRLGITAAVGTVRFSTARIGRGRAGRGGDHGGVAWLAADQGDLNEETGVLAVSAMAVLSASVSAAGTRHSGLVMRFARAGISLPVPLK